MNNFQTHKVDKIKSLQRLVKIFSDDIHSYRHRLNDFGKKATGEIELAEVIKLERRINEYKNKLQLFNQTLNNYSNINSMSDLSSSLDIFPEFLKLDEEFLEIRKSLYSVISNLKS